MAVTVGQTTALGPPRHRKSHSDSQVSQLRGFPCTPKARGHLFACFRLWLAARRNRQRSGGEQAETVFRDCRHAGDAGSGLYLSGYLTLLLLKLDTGLLKWNTYLVYFNSLDVAPVAAHAGKIKWGGYLGFGVPAAAWLALTVLVLKPKDKSLHGQARFASRGDLARLGLLKSSSNGIVVGKIGNTLIRLPGQQFAILAAPTRSGKGVGIVIPNLLEYQDSVVVLDIKGENFDLTSGWRAEQGQKIYRFNPYDLQTHRWNPMGYVSRTPALRISDIQAIAAMLYPDGSGEDQFWVSQARNAFLAFSLGLFESYDHAQKLGAPASLLNVPTLGAIFRLSSGEGTELKPYLESLSQKTFLSAVRRKSLIRSGALYAAPRQQLAVHAYFAMNASISSALRASLSVSTAWPSLVMTTSSSVRMPMPRHLACTDLSSGGM